MHKESHLSNFTHSDKVLKSDLLTSHESAASPEPETPNIKPNQALEQQSKLSFAYKLTKTLCPEVTLEIGPKPCESLLVDANAFDGDYDQQELIVINPSQPDAVLPITSTPNTKLFSGEIEFIEACSNEVLPDMLFQDRRIDFALISGLRPFDYTLVDAFYLDKMLDPGGVILFDFTDKPAVQKTCRFILNNLPYEIYDRLPVNSFRAKVDKLVRRQLYRFPLVNERFNQLIRPEAFDSDVADITHNQMIALRKLDDDQRTTSFHMPF